MCLKVLRSDGTAMTVLPLLNSPLSANCQCLAVQHISIALSCFDVLFKNARR